jgi:hypothetical protein
VAGAVALAVAGVLFLARGTSVTPAGSTQLTNINDTIVVRPTSGGVWLVGGAETGARLPPGAIVVHKSGDSR